MAAHAQQLPWFMDRDTLHHAAPEYVLLVPGQKPLISNIGFVNPNDIKSINILQGKNAVKLYGKSAEKEVVIISCKRKAKIIKISQIRLDSALSLYGISKEDQKLFVYIDSMLSYPTSNIYLETKKIKSVRIETEFVSGIRFINIITSNPQYKLKPGEVWIRGL